jgi:hypothetical protein
LSTFDGWLERGFRVRGFDEALCAARGSVTTLQNGRFLEPARHKRIATIVHSSRRARPELAPDSFARCGPKSCQRQVPASPAGISIVDDAPSCRFQPSHPAELSTSSHLRTASTDDSLRPTSAAIAIRFRHPLMMYACAAHPASSSR